MFDFNLYLFIAHIDNYSNKAEVPMNLFNDAT